MKKMKFKKQIINYMTVYISDIYKCAKYGKNWYAFFKPHKLKQWGNSCEKTAHGSQCYKSLKDAKEACVRHSERFGLKPLQNDYILQ